MGWRDEALERLDRGERVDRVTALLGIDRRTLIGLGHANGYRFDANGYAHRNHPPVGSSDMRDQLRPLIEHPNRKIARTAYRIMPLLDRLYADLNTDKARAEQARHKRHLEPQLRDLRGPSHAQIRAWARAQGLDVPSRGTVPVALRLAYLEAVGQSTT